MPLFALGHNDMPKKTKKQVQKPAVPPPTRLQPVVRIEVRNPREATRRSPAPQTSKSLADYTTERTTYSSLRPKSTNATYAPPRERNFATPPKPANAKKPEPAYRTMAPVYDDKIATNVYDRAMDRNYSHSTRAIVAFAEVCSQVREAVSAKRSAPKETTKEIIHSLMTIRYHSLWTISSPSQLPQSLPLRHLSNQSTIRKTPPPVRSSFPDPYETYLKSLPNGQTPDTLIVAKESSALRSIFPLVDHQQHVEASSTPVRKLSP